MWTFLAKNLRMNRPKNITKGPRNGGNDHRQMEVDEEEDEFAIRIERVEFDFSGHGDEGHGGATTILEEVSSTAAAASDEQRPKGTAAPAAAADRPVAAAAAVEDITKVRKMVTIKEDQLDDATASAGADKSAPALERKKSLFKKRQAAASSVGAPRPLDHQRPRMPVMRLPTNDLEDIEMRSSTFIQQRRKSFGSGGKPTRSSTSIEQRRKSVGSSGKPTPVAPPADKRSSCVRTT